MPIKSNAPRRWNRPHCSAGFVLLASFAFGACSSDDNNSTADSVGNNSKVADDCETRGDCAEPSGSSSSPDSSAPSSNDSEDPSTTEPCADAWTYKGMDLRVLSEASSGEGALDCTEDPDRIRSDGAHSFGIPDHTITETMTRCFEEALTAGLGAYAVERVQGWEYKFARSWAVTPEGELFKLSQEPMYGNVTRYKCGSLDGYLEGTDECSGSFSSGEALCAYGLPTGAPCNTDDDCRSPLICNLESQRCDQRCLSSECQYPDD